MTFANAKKFLERWVSVSWKKFHCNSVPGTISSRVKKMNRWKGQTYRLRSWLRHPDHFLISKTGKKDVQLATATSRQTVRATRTRKSSGDHTSGNATRKWHKNLTRAQYKISTHALQIFEICPKDCPGKYIPMPHMLYLLWWMTYSSSSRLGQTLRQQRQKLSLKGKSVSDKKKNNFNSKFRMHDIADADH